jgi:hypothetical protein
MAIFYINWQNDFVGNEYTTSTPEIPIGLTATRPDSSITTIYDSEYSLNFIQRVSSTQRLTIPNIPLSAATDYLGGYLLMLIKPLNYTGSNLTVFTASGATPFGQYHDIQVYRGNNNSVENAAIWFSWSNWNSYAYAEVVCPTEEDYWFLARMEPTNSVHSLRVQLKVWGFSEEMPSVWEQAVDVYGSAATSSNFEPLDSIKLFDSSINDVSLGPILFSNDLNEDLFSFLYPEINEISSINKSKLFIGQSGVIISGTNFNI